MGARCAPTFGNFMFIDFFSDFRGFHQVSDLQVFIFGFSEFSGFARIFRIFVLESEKDENQGARVGGSE